MFDELVCGDDDNLESIEQEDLPYFEKRLSKHNFLVGDDLSIADLLLFYQLAVLPLPVMKDFTHLLKWYHKMRAVPEINTIS